ncbi:hypothetical protein EM864_12460 [Stenotrophomonas acidaminiphila]|uniref:hypothetical protein n=1 Tax=Stenotrophomonas acidaminiphila TaxID=128780 RepID=UPI0024067800|nr:hypothetical protein [Stenotrophomonas acidaminiphila]MDF9442558.1 hypothetical protein [Stenotrophomonas acidaminiphila]
MVAAKKAVSKNAVGKKPAAATTEGTSAVTKPSGSEDGKDAAQEAGDLELDAAAPSSDAATSKGAGEGKSPVAPAAQGARGYRALWPVRANKRDFAEGEPVTGLSNEQAAELLAIGVIEKK